MSDRVIALDVKARGVAAARRYLIDMERLLRDGERAIERLTQALDAADEELKLRIVLMLGATADPQAIAPLYALMHDDGQSDSLRHAAAVQLSLLGEQCRGEKNWVARLLADLAHEDPFMRATAAFALGWEGNRQAVAPLVSLLADPDMEVQQAAVSALTNIRNDDLFDVLIERLISGSKEQQRCILYHLSCFAARREEVVAICARYLDHPDADLRYDALVVLDAVNPTDKPLALYLQSLTDPDPRIREVALVYLAGEEKGRLARLTIEVRGLMADPVPSIRQAATRLLHHIQNGPVLMTP
ncbi:HEAT repeat domain-containing protein [Desulfatitalea alkaliphila]|uniref:HEAT repeat domain-containing protein n=1 Tax=Desulfatitalea alkaliphila TaxID=2929485 RepID=A0AA41R2K2_9BACT|nr:HEAT repeat domain-containing protein [Desulfatitalea alkaliphila]MCJ8500902.1 HEAT repeat domain-containing protein [Desulfatitalea alkaliphila]